MNTVEIAGKTQSDEERRDRAFRTALFLGVIGLAFLAIGSYATGILITREARQMGVIAISCFAFWILCFVTAGKIMPRDPIYDLPEAEDKLFHRGNS